MHQGKHDHAATSTRPTRQIATAPATAPGTIVVKPRQDETTRRSPRVAISGRVEDLLLELTLGPRDWSASQYVDAIHRRLPKEPVPNKRTVQRWLDRRRAATEAARGPADQPWSALDGLTPDEAAHVLGILQDLPRLDIVEHISRRHASLIARIRQAAPDIPRSVDVVSLAFFALDPGVGSARVTECLAAAPWRWVGTEREHGPLSESWYRALLFWQRLQAWDDDGRWRGYLDVLGRPAADDLAARRRSAPPVASEGAPTGSSGPG